MINRMEIFACKYGEGYLPESWIFKGGAKDKHYPISLLFHLIKLEDRVILVDVGCDDFNMDGAKNLSRPVDVLRENGFSPKEITDILITHHHGDHIGAIGHYPNANIVIQRQEAELAKELLQNRRVTPFDDEIKLFNSRILMRKVGGHTIGSSIVLVPANDKTIVFAGDACYAKVCLEQRLPTGMTTNIDASRQFVEEYSNTKYQVLLAHDPSVLPDKNGIVRVFN